MQGELNNFGVKYGNQENITKKNKKQTKNKQNEWISNVWKELEGLEKRPKAKIHIDSLRTKNIKLKTPGYDGIHEFWFKNSPPSMTD